MPHDNDTLPMTPEKKTKLKAMEYINRFRAVGISLEKSQLAAVILVLELKSSFSKNFVLQNENEQIRKRSIEGYNNKLAAFDQLIKCIEAY